MSELSKGVSRCESHLNEPNFLSNFQKNHFSLVKHVLSHSLNIIYVKETRKTLVDCKLPTRHRIFWRQWFFDRFQHRSHFLFQMNKKRSSKKKTEKSLSNKSELSFNIRCKRLIIMIPERLRSKSKWLWSDQRVIQHRSFFLSPFEI